MPLYSGKTPCIKIHKARITFSANGMYKALYGEQPPAPAFAPLVCPRMPLTGHDTFFFIDTRRLEIQIDDSKIQNATAQLIAHYIILIH